jgi:hypothetical protein
VAPSHQRLAATASRLSGGVVTTTYAAATPAVTRTTFATVRAAARFTRSPQLRLELVEPVVGLLVGVDGVEAPYVDPDPLLVEELPGFPRLLVVSRTYRWASSVPRDTASRALS